eukprot:363957-Chlamydomonas_euryale.AAC.7
MDGWCGWCGWMDGWVDGWMDGWIGGGGELGEENRDQGGRQEFYHKRVWPDMPCHAPRLHFLGNLFKD